MNRIFDMQDVRHTLRAIHSTPGLTIIITLTLAIGIGATTAMFSVIDGVLLRPLPYPAPSALVLVTDVQRDRHGLPGSFPEYKDWRERTGDVFADVGALIGHGEVLSGDGDAEQLQGAMTSANVPSLLGVRPILGRTFRAEEEDAAAERVVMLSEGLWRQQFASDPLILGRSITLTGKPHRVIGIYPSTLRAVLPQRYGFGLRAPAQFWVPLNLTDQNSPRGLHFLDVIARLKPGVSYATAAARVAAVGTSLMADRATTHGIELTPLTTALTGNVRAPLMLLFAAVALLLAIACINVANLLLARTASRRREFAVRSALGAGRVRVARHVVLEGVLRAAIGGACGVLVAYGLVAAAHRSLGAIPRMREVTIDPLVLGVALVLSVGCGVLFSLVPAIRATRGDLVSDLRDGARGSSGGRGADRVRQALIVSEITTTFVVLVVGALLARSFQRLLAVPMGFDPDQLVAARTWLPTSRYPDSLTQIAFNDRLVEGMAERFGPANVTIASSLPLDGNLNGDITIAGRTFAPGTAPVVEKRIVGNTYFSVIGARLSAGRFFQPGDVLGSPAVAIVNEAFVRRWFPNGSPLGRQLGFGWQTSAEQTIVGVVADVHEGALDAPASPAVYVSAEQVPNSFMTIIVRSSRRTEEVGTAYRTVLRAIDPTLPVVDVRRASDIVASSVRQRRLTTSILGAFAIASLLLAAVGLFGVISYSVGQRTRELGVRAALGARRTDLMWLVLRQASQWLGAGIVLGAVVSVATGRLIAAQLFGITQTDPSSFAGTATLLAAVAFAACAAPTWRAARSDPLEALRAD